MATRPYRPSNGTGGDLFYADWCAKCRKDAEWRDTEANPCEILNRTLIYDIGEPEYPAEWVQDDVPGWNTNPRCTAFDPIDRDGLISDARQEALPI